jgi:centromeric protein E
MILGDFLMVVADKLLQFPSRTPELYNAKIAPLVDKAMNGFNSTIFA